MRKHVGIAAVALICAAGGVHASDYYVAATGDDNNNGSSDAPFATIDKAVITATSSDDVIHVAAGTYQTGYPDYVAQTSEAKWGPNLKAKLIGEGTTRADVVLESHGEYRTLRMAADSWLENVTIVGCTDISKADKGGAIEMSGGTVTNCVIRDGKAYASSNQAGGNLYMNSDAALVVDCLISGGVGKSHGGNVCLIKGTIRASTITKGTTYNEGEKFGANIYMSGGRVDTCTISEGDGYEGGEIYQTGGMVTNCTILANGVTRGSGGGIYMNGGTVDDCYIDGEGGTMSWHGGCIYMKNGTVKNTVCTNGVCMAAGSREGGNIYMENGTLENVTLADGQCAQDGGNLRMTGGTATKLTCIGGTAGRSGGNICASNGATIGDSTLSGGTAVSVGGNLYVYGSVTVSDCVISNGVTSADGGNIHMDNSTLENVTLRNGTASGKGGNLYVKTGTISGFICEDGTANGNGGNVYMEDAATITDGAIRRGTATSKGGNVYMGDGMLQDLEISGGVLTGNVSDGEGGGNIYWNNGRISRCSITGGKLTGTTNLRGGGINCVYTTSDNVTRLLEDCLLAENENAAIFCNRDFAAYNCSFINNAGASVNSWRAISLDFANCVIFGNTNSTGQTHAWTGNRPVFKNVATDDTSLSNTDGYIAITASAFVDYANGDYHPAADGALVDAGIADERADASDKDLDGKARLSEGIDIGCYEYKHTNMTVAFTAPTLDVGYAPATATFTASAENAPGEVSFEVDFGDGTEPQSFSTSEISHVYSVSGSYTITVVAVSGVERSNPQSRTIKIVDRVRRVGEGGFATISDALAEAVAGCEVIVAAGTHEVSSPVVIDKAVTVRGEGNAVLRNTVTAASGSENHRVMVVSGGALVSGLVIENGSILGGFGACVDVTGATVSNCVIRGGTATKGSSGDVAGGALALGSNAVITHCTITGSVVNGTSDGNGEVSGGAIYVRNSAKPVRILNTLVANNRYVCSGDTAKSGAAGVVFGGANENSLVENCTIVANTVEGALSSDSAGLYCTSWTVTFRNNAIAGNFETAKGESGTYTSARIDTAHCPTSYTVTDDVEPLNSNCSVSTVDEMFKNFANGNYSPKPKGALFDVGTTPSVPSAVDLTGNPRVMFAGIDIGCFECQRKLGFSVVIR